MRDPHVVQLGESGKNRLHEQEPFVGAQFGQCAVRKFSQPGQATGQVKEFCKVQRDIFGALARDGPQKAEGELLVAVLDVLENLLFAKADKGSIRLPDEVETQSTKVPLPQQRQCLGVVFGFGAVFGVKLSRVLEYRIGIGPISVDVVKLRAD